MNRASSPAISRQLFLADHCLASGEGHHLFYNRALAGAARGAGWSPVVLASRKMLPGILAPFEAEAVFRADPRARPPRWAQGHWRLLRALDVLAGQRFRGDLRRAFSRRPVRGDDLVFAQMITPRNLAAWAEWLVRLDARPKLAVHVAYDPSRYEAHPEFVRAWSKLRKSPAFARVFALTDSERFVDPYEKLLGLKVSLLPHVVSPEVAAIQSPAAGAAPVFGILGSPRRDKGFAEAVQAVIAASSQPEPPRFVVHTGEPDGPSKPWAEKLREAKLPNVRIVPQCMMGEAEYAALFGDVTVFVLPYHLDIYGARTSGIFCEALASGRATIVTEGSWMSGRAEQDAACIRVPEKDPGGLATAIGDARHRHEVLLAAARSAAPHFAREFSAGNFMGRLLEAAGEVSR